MKYKFSVGELRRMLSARLSHHFSVTAEDATEQQLYAALVYIARDLMIDSRKDFLKRAEQQNGKQVYYLCMEFLMGRSLKNNLFNLGLTDTVTAVLKEIGVKMERIYNCEPDAGLGNGGLGRLAACYLDGLASQGYPAMGYSLCYEYGIFRQKMVDGWQTEMPDSWLPGGEAWLVYHPEDSVTVNFDGEVNESWYDHYHSVDTKNCTSITAIPCDLMTAGYGGENVSVLRLWTAKSEEFNMALFNDGDYMRAVERNAMAEMLTKVLYPGDNHPEGKSLRLSQQYFLCSATMQDIIHAHLSQYGTMDNFPEKVAIHLNDTHPVLAIPETMRILLDECGYEWDAAWDIVTRTFAYTNHTVMAEALECWSEDLVKKRVPRVYQIIVEINRRFCMQLEQQTNNWDAINRMRIISDGVVKMANLAVACCHSVNGVSKLHSDILKDTVFHEFYTVMPHKFKNVTNGIAYRRWLNQSNPELAGFLQDVIGEKFITDAKELSRLADFRDDAAALEQIAKIKQLKKEQFAKYILKHNNVEVDPTSIFDVQVKRMHEYKRQLLNGLNILATYQYLKENPNADFTPRTYIFGAKAAPGYFFAKEIMRFLVLMGNVINNDPDVNQKIKLVYLEDYRVTVAEKLMPAADISEQISLAGTEASGTGNMKLMINGAITLGTLDGANVEIKDAVSKVDGNNILIFGMTTEEVEGLKRSGYCPRNYYENNTVIRKAIDRLRAGFGNVDMRDIADSLINIDHYMVLADYADYAAVRNESGILYRDTRNWSRMSLINTAMAGIFAADRAVEEYARTIWGTPSIK